MIILSLFITSNKVFLLLNNNGKFLNEVFPFYPFFQSNYDLEFLINSYLKSLSLESSNVSVIPISTIFNYEVFGKKSNYLSIELNNKNDFLYIYFDNLTFYSVENASTTSFGFTNRSDNFISNRSVYSCNKFNGDLEEVVYFSKAINKPYCSTFQRVVLGGDYFNNAEIPNEFKLNLITELLEKGFYEIYIDQDNAYPNFLNFRNNTSVPLKSIDFQKFCYLLSSDKPVEILLESKSTQKYLNLKINETYFLHINQEELKFKYKSKLFKNKEILLNSKFPGIFFDFRTIMEKKSNLGIENLRRVLLSIEQNNDYSSL